MSKNGSLIASEILVVDDEGDIRDLICGILSDEGYETRAAGDSDAALTAVRARRPQLVILDIWLQGSRLDGIQVLDALKREQPDVPVVMISGHGTIETAVASIKKGAYDFVEKPFKADRLIHVVERALEAARLKREVQELKLKTGDEGELVGQSSIVTQLRALVEKIAPTNSRVLISGPAGSGKEVAARLIHGRSRRAGNAFVAINCATMAPDRIEAELFGVENGEGPRKTGLFELAHNGTLYLDEVSDMPLETQGKILRVLIDQTFTRVGGNTRVQVDARVICSTTRDLRAETEGGRFREDLYHRLNVVPVRIPSLAERRDDIPPLITHFMKRLSAAGGLPMRNIADDAMAVLQAHSWPGNVRQLRNIVERLLILASDDVTEAVLLDLLPTDLGSNGGWNGGKGGDLVISLPLREAREIFERDYLMAQINRFGGNISRTAAFIGMERSALHRKLKSLGVGSQQSFMPDLIKWVRARPPAGRIAYVNGRYLPHGQAGVHVEDRGLQLGDSIYEVTNVRAGKPVDEEAHLDRLERSLKEIGMAMPMGRKALQVVMREMIARNRVRDGILYFQVTRGAARRDHVPPEGGLRPSLIMTARSQDMGAVKARMEKGVAVVTEPDQRWARCDIKTVQLLPNLLARQSAKAKGAFEAWLVDKDGFVTEGAATNAWIVDSAGKVVTRDLSRAILPGVTRRIILEAIAAAGMTVEERKFTVAEAKAAREAFLSSATGAGVPVVAIDGVTVGGGAPGPLTRRIHALYAEKAGISG